MRRRCSFAPGAKEVSQQVAALGREDAALKGRLPVAGRLTEEAGTVGRRVVDPPPVRGAREVLKSAKTILRGLNYPCSCYRCWVCLVGNDHAHFRFGDFRPRLLGRFR